MPHTIKCLNISLSLSLCVVPVTSVALIMLIVNTCLNTLDLVMFLFSLLFCSSSLFRLNQAYFLNAQQNFLAGLSTTLRVKLIRNNLLVTFQLTQQELSRKTS